MLHPDRACRAARRLAALLACVAIFVSLPFAPALAQAPPAVPLPQPPQTTPAHIPPQAVGNEANAEQLALASRQGAAYAKAVDWECAGAPWSSATQAGDLRLSVAVSAGEGGWDVTADGLKWSDPLPGTVHLRAFAADGADGRFVPGAALQAEVLDESNRPLATSSLAEGIYPLTAAYGADVTLPKGAATLVVRMAPLRWRRHDPYNGDRFSEATVAVFALPPVIASSGTPASTRAEQAPAALRDALNQSLDATVQAMWRQANAGAQQRAGDFSVVYAVEYAEAYWELEPKGFRYTIENEMSARYNAHVEVVPRDALSGNFLSATQVSARLVGPDGAVVPPPDDTGHEGHGGPSAPGGVPLMWHSWLYHFGQNWRVPKAGRYSLQVHIDAPPGRRYGKALGARLGQAVDVQFDGVEIKTGQK